MDSKKCNMLLMAISFKDDEMFVVQLFGKHIDERLPNLNMFK